jgi:hypothetical protein
MYYTGKPAILAQKHQTLTKISILGCNEGGIACKENPVFPAILKSRQTGL